MKKQWFTLIELLGVIVVLAIILLITIPSVLNIVEEAQKASFQNSAYAIVRAAELKHADNVLKNKDTSVNDCGTLGYEVYKYIDGKAEDIELAFKGKRPKSGIIAIKSDGDVYVCPENFSTLTKLPYINNVQVLRRDDTNFSVNNLIAGIIDEQIFVWGKNYNVRWFNFKKIYNCKIANNQ